MGWWVATVGCGLVVDVVSGWLRFCLMFPWERDVVLVGCVSDVGRVYLMGWVLRIGRLVGSVDVEVFVLTDCLR